jgi:hypothetical protein
MKGSRNCSNDGNKTPTATSYFICRVPPVLEPVRQVRGRRGGNLYDSCAGRVVAWRYQLRLGAASCCHFCSTSGSSLIRRAKRADRCSIRRTRTQSIWRARCRSKDHRRTSTSSPSSRTGAEATTETTRRWPSQMTRISTVTSPRSSTYVVCVINEGAPESHYGLQSM